MFFRSRNGHHYHATYGCSGATLLCTGKGLEPCAICCANGETEAHPMARGVGIAEWNLDKPTLGVKTEKRLEVPDLTDRHESLKREYGNGQTEPPRIAAVARARMMAMQGRTADDVARKFDQNLPSGALADDTDGNIRFELVKIIDSKANTLPSHQREQFRHDAQTTWNSMHPDCPMLVWGRDDDYYDSDTARGVVYRNWRQSIIVDRDGKQFTVYDKATGEEVTPLIAHYRYILLNLAADQVTISQQFYQSRLTAAMAERGNEYSQEYGKWLENKRKQSQKAKYWSDDAKADAWRRKQFEKERHFHQDICDAVPLINPNPTGREKELMDEVKAQERELENILEAMRRIYGLTEHIERGIVVEYMETDEYGQRHSYDPLPELN